MIKPRSQSECPECAADPGRRRFLATAGAAAAVAATGGLSALGEVLADPVPKGAKVAPAETNVLKLYQSLTAEQKAVCALPFADPKSTQVSANWHIVGQPIEKLFNAEQQRTIHEILR